jgi:hypothetical protein
MVRFVLSAVIRLSPRLKFSTCVPRRAPQGNT